MGEIRFFFTRLRAWVRFRRFLQWSWGRCWIFVQTTYQGCGSGSEWICINFLSWIRIRIQKGKIENNNIKSNVLPLIIIILIKQIRLIWTSSMVFFTFEQSFKFIFQLQQALHKVIFYSAGSGCALRKQLDPDHHWKKQLDPDPQKINGDPPTALQITNNLPWTTLRLGHRKMFMRNIYSSPSCPGRRAYGAWGIAHLSCPGRHAYGACRRAPPCCRTGWRWTWPGSSSCPPAVAQQIRKYWTITTENVVFT